jgi:hypothetical protein
MYIQVQLLRHDHVIDRQSRINPQSINLPDSDHNDDEHSNRRGKPREAIDRSIDQELTLGPVGPLRHMGVVVARHSTQLLLPSSATPIPTTFRSVEPIRINTALVGEENRSYFFSSSCFCVVDEACSRGGGGGESSCGGRRREKEQEKGRGLGGGEVR